MFIADQTFFVNDMEIVPMFDMPHVIKCVRNGLAQNTIKYKLPGEQQWRYATWDHILAAYKVGQDLPETTSFPTHIRENHVIKDKIKKMRVKHAAQVFSHSLGIHLLNSASGGMLFNSFIFIILLIILSIVMV